MKLKHKPTGRSIEAEISEVTQEELQLVAKDPEFSFDWKTEQNYEVYKIYLISDKLKALGLMSLIDIREEYRIHLNLLEVTKKNRGIDKEIDLIAACLIAFAAALAFKKGYFGFVSLEPKTKLIDHYQAKYGFSQYGRYLGIEGSASQKLIRKYLEDE